MPPAADHPALTLTLTLTPTLTLTLPLTPTLTLTLTLTRYYQPPLIHQQSWAWYLRRAHATAVALWSRGGDPWTKKQGGGVGTAQWGVMVGPARACTHGR